MMNFFKSPYGFRHKESISALPDTNLRNPFKIRAIRDSFSKLHIVMTGAKLPFRTTERGEGCARSAGAYVTGLAARPRSASPSLTAGLLWSLKKSRNSTTTTAAITAGTIHIFCQS